MIAMLTTTIYQDLDMYIFLENAIRGGVSTITKRFARANNPYMPDYDETKPTTYIVYLDANNLYGMLIIQTADKVIIIRD